MPDSGDPIAQAFRPVLPLMLSAAASKGGYTPEVSCALCSGSDLKYPLGGFNKMTFSITLV